MCGIMAYIGKKQAYPILLNGLKKLEYRGYDSSGVAIMNGSLSLLKKEGKVEALENFAKTRKTEGNIGIGHTRWATHGIPSDINAHPHQSQSGRLTIVHNGIIENHEPLREMLIRHGYTFQSKTDTEVLVQLIEWYQARYNLTTLTAFSRALQDVEGSFAVVLFDLYDPARLFAARRQSPMVLGIGNDECMISSDAMPLSPHVERVVYVEDDIIIATDDTGSYGFYDLDLNKVEQKISTISNNDITYDKGDYESFMLKEIHEQSRAANKLISSGIDIKLDRDINRIIITACGTSWHSGLIAEYMIEKYARINVEVEYASEFRYRNPVLSDRDLVIGISQSGETADTIAALEMAKDAGCKTMAIVNTKNSSIARLVDQVTLLNAGPEIGVASTKAFTNQLVTFCLVIIDLLENSDLELAETLRNELKELPSLIAKALAANEKLIDIAKHISQFKSAIFLGRGTMYPIALEGALKLKEISYIHAEGYPAGEMKHGPIALVDNQMPIIGICNNDEHLSKTLSNIQEMKARNGIIIILKSQDIEIPNGLADFIIETPACHDFIAPIIQNIPLQLLAYHTASTLELDVDKPRNLAKSVTVE